MKKTSRGGASHKKAADWQAKTDKLRKKLESAWSDSEHTLESLWHQSAVATLHWVGAHRSRVEAFRKSVKGTPVERVVNAALKAVRTEGRSARKTKPKARGTAIRRRSAAAH